MSSHARNSSAGNRRSLLILVAVFLFALPVIVISVQSVSVSNGLESSRCGVAVTQLKQLGEGLELFRAEKGRYPTATEGLHSLVQPPDGMSQIMPALPHDPWGNEYVYETGPDGYSLRCLGPDGRIGTADDFAADGGLSQCRSEFNWLAFLWVAMLATVALAIPTGLLILVYLALRRLLRRLRTRRSRSDQPR